MNIPTVTNKVAFFSQFTLQERTAYFAAIDAGNVNIRTLRELLILAPYTMEVGNEVYQVAVGILAAEGIITQQRAQGLMAQ